MFPTQTFAGGSRAFEISQKAFAASPIHISILHWKPNKVTAKRILLLTDIATERGYFWSEKIKL